ncbi:MAG: DUF721 domain-containing protein [Pyrinomonadaceae bacterium]
MEQLFGAIPTVVQGLEQHEKLDEAVVFAAWSRSVGEMLNERTVPVEFAGKRLVIAVTDKTWQRHLEELSPQMIVKMNSSLGQGTVRYIEFQIDEKTVRKSRTKNVSERHDASKILTPGLKRAALAIADEALRETFLDAAGNYLARQKDFEFEI